MYTSLLRDDRGTVSIEVVILSAALIGLVLSVIALVSPGALDRSTDIATTSPVVTFDQ